MKKEQSTIKLIGGIIFIAAVIFLVAKYGKPADNTKSNSQVAGTEVTSETTDIANSPYLGDKSKATIAIVEYSDFECPFCQKFFEETYPQIISNYVNLSKAIFVYRNLPLDFHQPAANKDANAALCVYGQKDNEAYFKMADLIYQNSGLNGQGIADDKLIQLAVQAGASEMLFRTCLSTEQYKDKIEADSEAGIKAGITGTPSFVIGKLNSDGTVEGEILVGAQPYSTFESVINKYLE